MGVRTCAVDGCGGKYYCKGYCENHYRRWRNHGDPLGGKMYGYSVEDQFWAKVAQDDGDCWIWIASCFPNGYGQFGSNGEKHLAHRFAYERVIGLIPGGLVLDHLCRNPRCVNPAHLEPVTQRENIRRGKYRWEYRTRNELGQFV